jgi:hypothetical protein
VNWKDHPVVIAVIASVGTFTVGSTIVSQFVIPTWLQLKDNQIALQKTQIENFESEIHKLKERLDSEPKVLQSEVAKLRLQLQMSESDNIKLRQDLDSLDPDSLFAASNVYPRGFRTVRIGDDIDTIRRSYPKDVEIKDHRHLFLSVTLNNTPELFNHITYYYGDPSNLTSGNTKILHILFQPTKRGKAAFDLIKNALVAKYGDRIMSVEKDPDDEGTMYVWPDVLGYRLRLDEMGTYHISKNE